MSSELPQDSPPELTPEQQKVLRGQSISHDGPGTVGRDFESLLGFIAEREVPVSGGYLLPALKLLPALNERMARPLDIRLQRAQLKSFPHLSGLYLLLRASGMTRLERVRNQRLLRLDEEMLQAWRSLNPTEQYFTLLETWLWHATEDVIGERDGPLGPFIKCVHFLQYVLLKGTTLAGSQAQQSLRYFPGLHNLALLEEFGLVEIQCGEPGTGRGWYVERVALTPFGDAVFALLPQTYPEWSSMGLPGFGLPPLPFDNKEETSGTDAEDGGSEVEGQPFGHWQSLFQPFFPQWRHNLTLPEPAAHEGIYVFKVSLGRVWRSIAIPSHFMLDSLSDSILDAFAFDHDHLYRFAYRNRFGARVEVHHPFMQEPPSTDRVTVADLPLRAGDAMTYLFDFGDHWEFNIVLERIEPPDASMKDSRVLEQHGQAPQQYPTWDEMED